MPLEMKVIKEEAAGWGDLMFFESDGRESGS